MNELSAPRSDELSELKRENAEYQSMCLILQDEVDRLMNEVDDNQRQHLDKITVKEDEISLLEERLTKARHELIEGRAKLLSARQNADELKMEIGSIWELIRHIKIVVRMPLEISPVAEMVLKNLSSFENFVLLANAETERVKLHEVVKSQDKCIGKLRREIGYLKDQSSFAGRRSSRLQTQSFLKNDSVTFKEDSLISQKTKKLETQLQETRQRCAELSLEVEQFKEKETENVAECSLKAELLKPDLVDFAQQTSFDVDYARMQELEFAIRCDKQEQLLLNERIVQLQEENERQSNDLAEYKLTEVEIFSRKTRDYAEDRAEKANLIKELQDKLRERDVEISEMLRRSATEGSVELSHRVDQLESEISQLEGANALFQETIDEQCKILEIQRAKYDECNQTSVDLQSELQSTERQAELFEQLVDVAIAEAPCLSSRDPKAWMTFFEEVERKSRQFDRIFAEKQALSHEAELAFSQLGQSRAELALYAQHTQRLKEVEQSAKSTLAFKAKELEEFENRLNLKEIESDALRSDLERLQKEYEHYRNMQVMAFDEIKVYYEGFHEELIERVKKLERENSVLKRPVRVEQRPLLLDSSTQAVSDDTRLMASLARTNGHLRSELENEQKAVEHSWLRDSQLEKQPKVTWSQAASERDLLVIFSGRPVEPRFEPLVTNMAIVRDEQIEARIRLAAAGTFFHELEKALK